MKQRNSEGRPSPDDPHIGFPSLACMPMRESAQVKHTSPIDRDRPGYFIEWPHSIQGSMGRLQGRGGHRDGTQGGFKKIGFFYNLWLLGQLSLVSGLIYLYPKVMKTVH